MAVLKIPVLSGKHAPEPTNTSVGMARAPVTVAFVEIKRLDALSMSLKSAHTRQTASRMRPLNARLNQLPN